VFSYTEPREALLHYKEWLLASGDVWQPATVAEGRPHGKALVARLAGADDRDAAARYVGADVAVDRGCLPEPEPGEYYWADLEGLQVRHRDGRVLGRVAQMLGTGAHDVIVVRGAPDGDREREILIPFVPGVFVLGVDLEAGVIDVDWEWD
jgi:16S rRNA processing protein RimM